MTAYIDKDLAIKTAIDMCVKVVGHGITQIDAVDIADAFENIPTADVVEVRHGEWIEHFSFGCWYYDCPFCDDGYATKEKDQTPPNYCGNCGAKMDGTPKERGGRSETI